MGEHSALPAGTTGRRARTAIVAGVALAAGILGAAIAVKFLPTTIQGRRAYQSPVDRAGEAAGGPASGSAAGQLVYVPVYSHVYHRGGRAFLLEVTLSVRNTDRFAPVTVLAVDYHDTLGRRVRRFLDRPLRLQPLAAAEFLVEEKEESGGSGASFLVQWSSDAVVSEPVIEAVMIGTAGGQGISFLSRGQAVAEPPTGGERAPSPRP